MTTLKKNTLAVALVAAMGFAANASAFTVYTSGDTDAEMIATFDIASNSTVVDTAQALEIILDDSATEYVLARTTGLNITIELSNGALFNATPTMAETVIGAPNSTWTPTVIAGGAGASFVTIKLDPASTPVGLVPGALVSFTTLHLKHLAALQTKGQSVNATVTFVDPNTAQPLPLYTSKTIPVITSGDPNQLSCDASYGDVNSKIDVGTDGGNYESKTTFSYYGEINGGGSYYFDAGNITINADSDFAAFSYQSGDEFETVLTGTSFSAFADGSVWMYNSCGGNNIEGTVSEDGTSVTFDYTGADLASSSGGCWYVEFHASGAVIDATAITATTTFTRGSYSSTQGNTNGCALLPMVYNGSVVKVATFNPAGNATQQSFLRISNPSNVSGKVTIDGTDDSGNAGDAVTLDLAAGESVQINSDILENGGTASGGHALSNGMGSGDGKWRLVITGEFGGMRVQSLNRNNTTGTVTNLTDYDTAQEQNTPVQCGNVYDYYYGRLNSCYGGSDSY